MKTIKNTLALFAIALSFAACTGPTIEPVKPAYPSQLHIIRPDTTVTGPIQPTTESDAQPKVGQPWSDASEQPGRSPYQLASVDHSQPMETPHPVEVPRQTVVPVVVLDSLAQ